MTGNYWDYPTGVDAPATPGRDITELTNAGNNANYRGTPFPIDSPYYTTVVGQFQSSDSPYGTFDQGGNVGEWNELILGSYRGMRGGTFNNDSFEMLAPYPVNYYATNETGVVGFRVGCVPEPCSISLLVCGAIVGLIWSRRRV